MTALVDPGRTRWLQCAECLTLRPTVPAMQTHKTEQGCAWVGTVGEAAEFLAGYPSARQETL
jgi:hypothetical protein